MDKPKILVTICARGGSKGVPSKNIKVIGGKPLIAHSIEQAKAWGRADAIVVSTDSEAIAAVARQYGAEVPFLRPAPLASDTADKGSAISHALAETEKLKGHPFDVVVDLDATSPMRTAEDLERGWKRFCETRPSVCFSVVPARKNPYFNVVERDASGNVQLVKKTTQAFTTRQSAPKVWDMNASIYFYTREHLVSRSTSFWEGKTDFFEMPSESAFDIDEELDVVIVEALMNAFRLSKLP